MYIVGRISLNVQCPNNHLAAELRSLSAGSLTVILPTRVWVDPANVNTLGYCEAIFIYVLSFYEFVYYSVFHVIPVCGISCNYLNLLINLLLLGCKKQS